MRIATYNVEWFNSLFDADDMPLADGGWSGRYDITRKQQLGALATVFKALDADALMIIEAPDHSRKRNTVRALENFAAAYGLRARAAVTGFTNDTQQEIALMYDPDALTAKHAPVGGGKGAQAGARFDGKARVDLDADDRKNNIPETVHFSKPPLELDIETASGARFHMIGAHLKSKAPHGANTPDEVMRFSIENRRKQLAQAIWLRTRISAHLDAGTPLMVLGDMNDGPGLDKYENLFGRSSVEVLLGKEGEVPLFDPHAARALVRKLGAVPTTARFWIRPEKRYLQALLDYIMISPELCAKDPKWRIWHPLDDPACWNNAALRDALVTASDHFPVTLDITV